MYNALIRFAVAIPGLDKNLPQVDTGHSNIATILNALYVVAGALAVIFVIVGGIRYSLSGGDSSKIAGAKNTILYAVIGLAVTIFAFAITNFVIGKLSVTSFDDLRTSIINNLIYAAGAISVIMIVFGGLRYVLSQGDSSKITQAKNTILYAVIGLAVSILAFAVVNFVIANI